MAVEVEGTSQVEEFLGILKRRAWWIVIPTIVLGALGIAVAVIIPKKFVATAAVLVRDATGSLKQSSVGAVSRMEGFVAPHVIGSRERIAQALNEFGWPEYLQKSVEEQTEYRAEIGKDLVIGLQAVQNNSGTQIVRARFSHTSPQRAYDFLNKIVDSWKSEVQGRFEVSERTNLETLRSTEDQLNAELTKISADLELKRRANKIRPDVIIQGRDKPGLLASSEFGQLVQVNEAIDADVETLNELQAQIADWEKQFNSAQMYTPRAQGAEGEGSIEADIKAKEKEKRDLEQAITENGWLVNSTQYKKAQQRIEAIVELLDELRGVGASGSPNAALEVVNPQRIELASKLEEARQRYARTEERRARNELKREQLTNVTNLLYREHEAINFLQAQFDTKKKSLEEVGTSRRLQEAQVAAIESDAGTFFEDLESPHVPSRPTTPNPYLIAAFFLAAGLSLGFGVAILSELSRSTFRNARDLSRVMVVPVLGTVNRIVTRRQRSRHFFANVALATATLAVVCIVGYVTWAWVNDQDALSEPVLSAIRGLREPFL